jgi:hypothetical protein
MTCLPLLAAMSLIATDPGTMASMKWQRRVLLVSAPTHQDPKLAVQRRIIGSWKVAAADRDLSIVEVVGDKVAGATDPQAVLRRKYRLSTTGFTAILIGKDGGEKLRSATPISAAVLEDTIDAMPMRQAGER